MTPPDTELLEFALAPLTVTQLRQVLLEGPAAGSEEDIKRVKKMSREEALRAVVQELRLPPWPDWLEEARTKGPPERLSVSYLKAAEECLFRALAERAIHTNGAESDFGSAFHEVAAAAATRCELTGKETLDTAELHELTARVLNNTEELSPWTWAQHQRLQDVVERWGYGFTYPLDADLVLIEWGAHTVLEVDGFPETFSARLDLVTIRGAYAEVEDYKAGPSRPADEEVEEHIQVPLYAWHIFKHHPQVEEVTGWENYVRHGFKAPRDPLTFTRDDIPRLEDYLATVTRRVRTMYAALGEDHEYRPPANDGSWCAWCPVKRDCPLPKQTRPAAIETEEEALQELSAHVVATELEEERRAGLKAYMEAHGLEELGLEEVGKKRLVTSAQTSLVFDKQRAAHEEGFEVDKYRVPQETTPTRLVKVKAPKKAKAKKGKSS